MSDIVNVSPLGANVATFLATPSSANLAAALTDETGTAGAAVFSASPSLTGSPTAPTQTPSDNSTKIATTAYVDAAVLGQNYKEAAKYATTAALPTVVYANGSSGVGATLTAVGLGAISLDGNTPSVADRVLVKNQVSTFQNGIYTVTTVGSGAAFFVLTRSLDANQTTEFKTGDSIFVTAGTTQASTTWAYTGIDSPTIGTDAITYAQAAGPGSYTAGNGIAITGTSIAIDTAITVDKTTAQTLTNKTLTSPILTTPNAGTPSAIVLTNATGFPAAIVQTGQSNTYSTGAQDMTSATSHKVPASAGYAPTATGSVGYDTTQGGYVAGGQGTITGYIPRVLYVANSTTDTLTAATITTTETQFATTWQIPANYLITNKILRVTYLLQSLATATIPTSLFKIRLGSVGITGTTVYTSTAGTATAGTRSGGIQFMIQGTAAAGASANVITGSAAQNLLSAASQTENVTVQPVAVATNAAENINLTLTYGGSGASNTWTVLSMLVEELN